MAHEIFISYAGEDRQTAEIICRALEQEGIRCWIAPRDVPLGMDYEDAIIDAISTSRILILILSAHSNESAHVKREIQNACAEGSPTQVISVRIDNVSFSKALKYYLGSSQWLDAATPPIEEHLPRLVGFVHTRLSQQQAQPQATTTTEQTKPQAQPTTGAKESEEAAEDAPAREEKTLATLDEAFSRPLAHRPAHRPARELGPDFASRPDPTRETRRNPVLLVVGGALILLLVVGGAALMYLNFGLTGGGRAIEVTPTPANPNRPGVQPTPLQPTPNQATPAQPTPTQPTPRTADALIQAQIERALAKRNLGRVKVSVKDGRVTLTGIVLATEQKLVAGEEARVNGVTDVDNQLRIFKIPQGLPIRPRQQ